MYNTEVKVGAMRKKIIIMMFLLLCIAMTGCSSEGDVKVYSDTEDVSNPHVEVSMTAVILSIDLEQNIIGFKDCRNQAEKELIYHGGVRITNSYDRELSINDLRAGSVVDVVYYEDTTKLVSITESSQASTISNIKKFSANKSQNKATYKGTSCSMSEGVVAINHDGSVMDVSEVSTEDMVTLHMFGTKLVSVVVDEGHGYVRLSNQDSYVGGMIEIGYDVIVPVTNDMLLTVREGTYTLRVSKNGYSSSKKINVLKDSETFVDLSDIAIPEGTAVFEVYPTDARIYINGSKISGYTYTGNYASYGIKVEADGYKTYRGSFKINDTVNSYTINLVKTSGDEDDDTTETTQTSETTEDSQTEDNTQTTDEGSTTDASTSSEDDTQAATTESGVATGNVIKIKTPALASVYVDGDYVGVAPVTFEKVTGAHTITLYRSGYLIKSYTIYATDDGKDDEYSYPELTSLLDLID